MKCGGVPESITRRHWVVFMDFLLEENGIRVYKCPVCGRFSLEWVDD